MGPEVLSVRLELELGADPIAGWLYADGQGAHPFSGWLSLNAAIESARAAAERLPSGTRDAHETTS